MLRQIAWGGAQLGVVSYCQVFPLGGKHESQVELIDWMDSGATKDLCNA